MTAYRVAVIECNGVRCVHTQRAHAASTSVRALRATAREQAGWRYWDRKDWCPDHGAELGIRPPVFKQGDRVQWYEDAGRGPERTGTIGRVERHTDGLVAYIGRDDGMTVSELVDDLTLLTEASLPAWEQRR